MNRPLLDPLLKGEGDFIVKVMDTPSLAPYTAQGEGWDEGYTSSQTVLLKHIKN